jgi:hypothetical protein
MSSTNFRGKFYSNLGVQGVNIKNADLVFSENIIGKDTLKQIFLNQSIPEKYHAILWKRFLDVYSEFKESWSFVDDQISQEFADLKEASLVLNGSDDLMSIMALKKAELGLFSFDTIPIFIQVFSNVFKAESDVFWGVIALTKYQVVFTVLILAFGEIQKQII